MAQVEQPGNPARQDNSACRLATLILIRCGLRISDALKLLFDCTVTRDAGALYLRYRNNKMKREALVPLVDELLELIRGQQQRVLDRYPSGKDRYPSGKVLLPQPAKNPDGKPGQQFHLPAAVLPPLEHCDVRNEQGRDAHLPPYQ